MNHERISFALMIIHTVTIAVSLWAWAVLVILLGFKLAGI